MMIAGITAGIGCRTDARPEAILAAITTALRQADRVLAEIGQLASLPTRCAGESLQEVAAGLGLDLVAVRQADLLAAAAGCLTDSPRVRAATGLPSVAEAAALAAAGPGARLLGPRVAVAGATCALAEAAPETLQKAAFAKTAPMPIKGAA